jgi:uncharacterized protein
MVIDELTDRECRAVLARTHLARLACSLNNQPYIVPIHFEFHDGYLLGFATAGQKIEWMRENPLVCVEVEEVSSDRQWTTVVISGRYEELPDTPSYDYERSIAQSLFQRRPLWWEPASVPLGGRRPRPLILFRILIVRMTGRHGGPDKPEAPVLLNDVPDAERSRGPLHMLRRALRLQPR